MYNYEHCVYSGNEDIISEDIDDGKRRRICSVSRCVLSSSYLHFLVGIDLVAELALEKNKADHYL